MNGFGLEDGLITLVLRLYFASSVVTVTVVVERDLVFHWQNLVCV